MSLREIVEIVGLLVVVAGLVCGVLIWRQRHPRHARDLTRRKPSDPNAAQTRAAVSQEASSQALPPSVVGKLRAGREGDRLSEDDLVRAHMGPRGIPGEPAPANTLRESETQIPKPLDPGHTA
jgi:hypothetical protein